AVLFIPVILAARQLYVWIDPPASLGKEVLENIAHKHGYLNVGGFVARAAVYFVIWIVVSELLYRHSLRQDEDPAPQLTARARRLAARGSAARLRPFPRSLLRAALARSQAPAEGALRRRRLDSLHPPDRSDLVGRADHPALWRRDALGGRKPEPSLDVAAGPRGRGRRVGGFRHLP